MMLIVQAGELIRRPVLAVLFVALAVLETSCARPPGNWTLIERGERVESGHNDGDSVAVRAGGETHVFRIYFVDTLETNPRSEERLVRQAASFGIGPERLEEARALAWRAKAFTAAQTGGPVRVWTRWEKVSPGSDNPSIRAFIEGRDGDLAAALVREGLAVIKSGSALSPHPDGRTAEEILRGLRAAEAEARRERRGGWARPDGMVEKLPDGVIAAGETSVLKGMTGRQAAVQGRVGRIGALPEERIVFINFSGNNRGDFCGIIRSNSLSPLRKVFGGRFPYDLEGREIKLSGQITEHRGTPQIEIEAVGQVEILDTAGR